MDVRRGGGPPVNPENVSLTDRKSPFSVTVAMPVAGDAFDGTSLVPRNVVE